jgi:hypothetical protein
MNYVYKYYRFDHNLHLTFQKCKIAEKSLQCSLFNFDLLSNLIITTLVIFAYVELLYIRSLAPLFVTVETESLLLLYIWILIYKLHCLIGCYDIPRKSNLLKIVHPSFHQL